MALSDCPRVTQPLCCHCIEILGSDLQAMGPGGSVATGEVRARRVAQADH